MEKKDPRCDCDLTEKGIIPRCDERIVQSNYEAIVAGSIAFFNLDHL